MSRIYNLKAVVPTTGGYISDRSSDVPAHGRKPRHEGRFRPGSPALSLSQEPTNQQSERRARDGQPVVTMDTSELQSVQRQVEQLQLREQEVEQSTHSDGNPWHGLQRVNRGKKPGGQKLADAQTGMHKAQTPSPSQHTGTRLQSKPPQTRSFTINAWGSRPLENTPIPPEQDNIESSPITPSSVSLCPTPPLSSPLFSIRSASGGPGKRGTTITITPRRTATQTPAPAGPSGLTTQTPAPAGPSGLTPQTPAPAPKASGEGHKKRYPTVEEIEVIGGYKNLENSCLVKHRGPPKELRVCFDDSRLERVCEYPSEASFLASLPRAGEELGSDPAVRAEPESDGQEEEEEEEGRAFMDNRSKSLGAGTGMSRVLRVDESCRR